MYSVRHHHKPRTLNGGVPPIRTTADEKNDEDSIAEETPSERSLTKSDANFFQDLEDFEDTSSDEEEGSSRHEEDNDDSEKG